MCRGSFGCRRRRVQPQRFVLFKRPHNAAASIPNGFATCSHQAAQWMELLSCLPESQRDNSFNQELTAFSEMLWHFTLQWRPPLTDGLRNTGIASNCYKG